MWPEYVAQKIKIVKSGFKVERLCCFEIASECKGPESEARSSHCLSALQIEIPPPKRMFPPLTRVREQDKG